MTRYVLEKEQLVMFRRVVFIHKPPNFLRFQITKIKNLQIFIARAIGKSFEVLQERMPLEMINILFLGYPLK